MKISILLPMLGLTALLGGCDSGASSSSAPAGNAAPSTEVATQEKPEKTTQPSNEKVTPQPMVPAPAGATQAEVPDLSGDTSGPLVGMVEGREFTPAVMRWRSGALDLSSDEQPFPELGVRIFFRKIERSTVPFGKSWRIGPGMKSPLGLEIQFRARHLETRKPETKLYKDGGYKMFLSFDPDKGEGPLTGFVEVVTDNPQYSIKGNFSAEFSGVRTEDHGVVDVLSTNMKTMAYIVHERLKRKFPDNEVTWMRAETPRVHKTAQRGFRIGCLQVEVRIDGEPRKFGATLAYNQGEGWSCAEILEPYQIPDAFPVLEPQTGNLLHYLEYSVARRIQDGIGPGSTVTDYKATLKNNMSRPLNRVLATANYVLDGNRVSRRFILRHKDPDFLIDHELMENEVYDLEADTITLK